MRLQNFLDLFQRQVALNIYHYYYYYYAFFISFDLRDHICIYMHKLLLLISGFNRMGLN